MPQDRCPSQAAELACPRRRWDPRRWALVSVGLVCVALGALGVFVPGLPTTIFLILASWCFAKSCPPMERWLQEQKLFKPYTRYLDPSVEMPTRVRVLVIGIMWAAVLGSGYVFYSRGLLEWAAAPLAIAGVIAMISIWRFRRGARAD